MHNRFMESGRNSVVPFDTGSTATVAWTPSPPQPMAAAPKNGKDGKDGKDGASTPQKSSAALCAL